MVNGTPRQNHRARYLLFVERSLSTIYAYSEIAELENFLDSYGLPIPETTWRGESLTNVRLGEELGPAYLSALGGDSVIVDGDARELQAVIEHYLQTDLEANLAVYYSDIGESFEPAFLDSPGAF